MAEQPGRPKRGRAGAAAIPEDRAAGSDRAAMAWGRAASARLSALLAEEAEAGRPALWLPVAFGCGAAIYFSAGREPELWASAAPLGLGLGLLWLARGKFLALWLALGLTFGGAGFLAGKLATVRAEAPTLERPLRGEVVGRVLFVEPRARGMRRLTIAPERFITLAARDMPARVRVTARADPPLAAGDRIALTALWRPPEGPVRPGGYDFARVAFFEQIGATGYGAKDIRILPASPGGFMSNAAARLERLRADLTARISAAVGGPEGAVAAALVTGVQGPIPPSVSDDLRAAGLSHILSISGLHMALVAGTLFWFARALLALSQRAALSLPVKEIGAAVALAGATFYLALSGAEVATQRSYVMIAVALLAVMIGRPALAPRNFALAGLLVTAWTPEALLGPSFQMSFAAVAGLVAWFETRRDLPPAPPPASRGAALMRRLRRAATLAVMTTLVAGLATAPFAAYHFQRLTPYALAGNGLAEPLVGLVVMPAAIAGLLCAPLGLDAIWWRIMGLGLQGVLAVAHEVASWPGAERNVVAFGPGALGLFALGVAWLCLWRTALRWGGVPILGAALALAAFPARPDVVIDASGRALAARAPDGGLALVGASPGRFAAKVWFAADGSPAPTRDAARDVRCDAYGCTAPLAGGGVVALSWDPRGLEEDCRRAALVVTRLDAPAACAETVAVVDRRILAATGALSLTRSGDGFSGVAALDPAGSRPWTRQPRTPPPAAAARLAFAPTAPVKDIRPPPVDPTDATEAEEEDETSPDDQ